MDSNPLFKRGIKPTSMDMEFIQNESHTMKEWAENILLIDPSKRVENIVFLDTETTDIKGFTISIALIEFSLSTMSVVSEYYKEINPLAEIAEDAVGVHGFTNEFVKTLPMTFKDISHEVIDIINRNDCVCAFNALFDISVLIRDFERLEVIPPAFQWFDPMERLKTQIDAKNVLGRKKDPKLEEAANFFGIDTDEGVLHNALFDTQVLVDVFVKALESYE